MDPIMYLRNQRGQLSKVCLNLYVCPKMLIYIILFELNVDIVWGLGLPQEMIGLDVEDLIVALETPASIYHHQEQK